MDINLNLKSGETVRFEHSDGSVTTISADGINLKKEALNIEFLKDEDEKINHIYRTKEEPKGQFGHVCKNDLWYYEIGDWFMIKKYDGVSWKTSPVITRTYIGGDSLAR